jgi:Mce-associated membrane protein
MNDDTTHEEVLASDRLSLPDLRPYVLRILLAVLVVAVAIATVLQSRQSESTAEPLAVARQEAVNFFSLDHRTADRDVKRVLALATGDFREEYEQRSAEIISGMQEKKLAVAASVPDDGVALEFLDDRSARVLVSVDVVTMNPADATKQPAPERYRTRLTLELRDGAWLVSGLDQV